MWKSPHRPDFPPAIQSPSILRIAREAVGRSNWSCSILPTITVSIQLTTPIISSRPDRSFKKAVLVISNASSSGTGRLIYSLQYAHSTGVAERPVSVFSIIGAYPNPFNPTTTIRFTLPKEGKVTAKVYNVTGQKVANLFDGILSAGENTILWKPSGLSGGVYFVTVASGNETRTAKVLLLK